MQRPQKISGVRRIAQWATAGLLILSLLMTVLMAASPSLHEYFHHDADQADHSCAVTLFTHGGVTMADVPTLLALFVPLLLCYLLPLISAEFTSSDLRLGFSRGPPAFLSYR